MDSEIRLMGEGWSDQVQNRIQKQIDRLDNTVKEYDTDIALQKVEISNVENEISDLEMDRDILIGIPKKASNNRRKRRSNESEEAPLARRERT
jgi:hypothetical protein